MTYGATQSCDLGPMYVTRSSSDVQGVRTISIASQTSFRRVVPVVSACPGRICADGGCQSGSSCWRKSEAHYKSHHHLPGSEHIEFSWWSIPVPVISDVMSRAGRSRSPRHRLHLVYKREKFLARSWPVDDECMAEQALRFPERDFPYANYRAATSEMRSNGKSRCRYG